MKNHRRCLTKNLMLLELMIQMAHCLELIQNCLKQMKNLNYSSLNRSLKTLSYSSELLPFWLPLLLLLSELLLPALSYLMKFRHLQVSHYLKQKSYPHQIMNHMLT